MASEVRRRVVQDHEINRGALHGVSQGRDQVQMFLDPIRLRRVDGPVEQNAEVDITFAVRATGGMGAEQVRPDQTRVTAGERSRTPRPNS